MSFKNSKIKLCFNHHQNVVSYISVSFLHSFNIMKYINGSHILVIFSLQLFCFQTLSSSCHSMESHSLHILVLSLLADAPYIESLINFANDAKVAVVQLHSILVDHVWYHSFYITSIFNSCQTYIPRPNLFRLPILHF